jgi:pyridoxal phosphate enzyme (YggS family)
LVIGVSPVTDAALRTLLADRLAAVRGRIATACTRAGRQPTEVTLVAVTKTVSPRVAGLMAENRPQELWRKAEALKHLPIRWHLIGHLQRNKVERTLPLVHMIHSIDSLRLLQAVAETARKRGSCPPILLQVNASHEEQKDGFGFDELIRDVPRIVTATAELDLAGLMCMAAYANEPERARPTFRSLREFRDRLRAESVFGGVRPLAQLSMGMSGDFEVAVEEGATLVRIGTTLFEGLEAE